MIVRETSKPNVLTGGHPRSLGQMLVCNPQLAADCIYNTNLQTADS